MVDKQRAPRFRVEHFGVVYDTGESFWSGPVLDLSESGLFIETTHELPVGAVVTIIPDVDDAEGLPFEIRAEVVRVQRYDLDAHPDRTPGLALRWVQLSVDQVSKVRAFLVAHGAPVGTGHAPE